MSQSSPASGRSWGAPACRAASADGALARTGQLDSPVTGSSPTSDEQAQKAQPEDRREQAMAYLAWEAGAGREGLDDLDWATAKMSLDGAEW